MFLSDYRVRAAFLRHKCDCSPLTSEGKGMKSQSGKYLFSVTNNSNNSYDNLDLV